VPARRFSLTAVIAAPPHRVIDFLMRLDGHRGMHPYLHSARVVATGDSAGAEWWDWRVVERPALGPFRYTIRFPARMTRTSETSMHGRVRAAPGCHLDTTTTGVVTDRGTVVTETTVVTAPLPVLGYMTRHARIAHTRTFSLLPAELDGAH
jgi:hypothetical protein